jgi:hypothetical protein
MHDQHAPNVDYALAIRLLAKCPCYMHRALSWAKRGQSSFGESAQQELLQGLLQISRCRLPGSHAVFKLRWSVYVLRLQGAERLMFFGAQVGGHAAVCVIQQRAFCTPIPPI